MPGGGEALQYRTDIDHAGRGALTSILTKKTTPDRAGVACSFSATRRFAFGTRPKAYFTFAFAFALTSAEPLALVSDFILWPGAKFFASPGSPLFCN